MALGLLLQPTGVPEAYVGAPCERRNYPMAERQDSACQSQQPAEIVSDVERLQPAAPPERSRQVLDRLVAVAHGERDVVRAGRCHSPIQQLGKDPMVGAAHRLSRIRSADHFLRAAAQGLPQDVLFVEANHRAD